MLVIVQNSNYSDGRKFTCDFKISKILKYPNEVSVFSKRKVLKIHKRSERKISKKIQFQNL